MQVDDGDRRQNVPAHAAERNISRAGTLQGCGRSRLVVCGVVTTWLPLPPGKSEGRAGGDTRGMVPAGRMARWLFQFPWRRFTCVPGFRVRQVQ